MEARDDVSRFDALIGRGAEKQARVIVDEVEDLADLAAGQLPGGDVRLPISLGSCASKRVSEQRGRFCGWRSISPSLLKMRQIVEREGVSLWV